MNKKHTQNIVAESRHTLPITILYGIGIWFLAGLAHQGWWFQFVCFLASVYTMIRLNNSNLLIRIYSRSVSVFYILLYCITTWTFPSVQGSVVLLCSALALLLLFYCYQDQRTTGKSFYIFLLISIVSLVEPLYLLFIPIFLLLMATTVYSLSFRTFLASLIGLITPYWLYTGWQLFIHRTTPTMSLDYLKRFTDINWTTDYTAVTYQQWAFLILIVILFIVGSIHFWITSYKDKIRVRQIYNSLIMLTIYTIVLIALQPQKFDVFIGMLTIAVAPIIAHFVSLTRTRMSNIFFFVMMAAILLQTCMNLWNSLSTF